MASTRPVAKATRKEVIIMDRARQVKLTKSINGAINRLCKTNIINVQEFQKQNLEK